MSPAPPIETAAGRDLYQALLPLAYADEEHGYPLLHWCDAIGSMTEEIEQLVRDTPAGPGWSALLDVDRAPTKALPWLGQMIGVTVPQGTDDATARDLIREEAGFKRGTAAAIAAAAQRTLTGTKTVLLRERFGADAYALRAITFTAETPDAAATLAAMITQKPAGIVLTHLVITGQDYELLYANNADYQEVFTKYATYEGAYVDAPGT